MNVIGRSFGSDTVAEKDESGDWKVVVTMTEKRLIEGSDWEVKKISAQCTDKRFEKAYAVAMNSTLEQFTDALGITKSDSLFELDEADVLLEDTKEEVS